MKGIRIRKNYGCSLFENAKEEKFLLKNFTFYLYEQQENESNNR